jgi:hypothetical protein
MNASIIKQPSAFLPIAMSLVSLSLVLGHVAAYGFAHETDEGTAAHIFQLLMAGQVPIIGYFALTRLPRNAAQTLVILALQAVAAMAAFGALYWFESQTL